MHDRTDHAQDERERGLDFGISVIPAARQLGLNRELTLLAEEEGLDLVGVQDHPYVGYFMDTFSLVGTLLAETGRIRLFPDVASLPLRPPAMMAKAAASLDIASGGRFELGIGAGAYGEGAKAMGARKLSGPESVVALEEAIAVIRAMWSGAPSARVRGEYYSLSGVRPGPAPAHEIGLWVGALGPRMLRLTGRLADGWAAPNPNYLPYERLGEAMSLIDEGARRAGRDPADVFRLYQVPGTIQPATGLGRQYRPPQGSEPLQGSIQHWVAALTDWALTLGFDAFVFWPERPSAEQVGLFAREVAPAVREAVQSQRAPA